MTGSIAKRIQADWPFHLSYDKGDQSIDDFYSSIKGVIREKNSIFYEKRQIDIFLFAMAIGKSQNSREKIKKSSNSIRRDALTEEETWMMCGIVLGEENAGLDALSNTRELIKTCEEYSNGGIKTLMVMEKDRLSKGMVDPYETFLERAIEKSENQS